MSDPITGFFQAWQVEDANARLEIITQSVVKDIEYSDPRTPECLSGIKALNDYVGLFSSNAPGWTARVVKTDTNTSITRVTVAFSGQGPDGIQQTQYGQYFIEQNSELITRMIGFVGTGEPE